MSRVHARYSTAGGRTVTVVDNLPILRSGYQCDGCWDQRDRITDVADMDRLGRSHAANCTLRGIRPRPVHWGLT